jgi:hypothetical protein
VAPVELAELPRAECTRSPPLPEGPRSDANMALMSFVIRSPGAALFNHRLMYSYNERNVKNAPRILTSKFE